MAITPQIISWSYQKGSGIVPNTIVKVTTSYSADKTEIITEDKPNWLNVFLDTFEMRTDDPRLINYFNVKVSIVPAFAKNLSIGNHQARLKIGYPLPFLGAIHYQYLTINISVTEVQKLRVSLPFFTINYTQGDPLPSPRYVTITTSRNWSIISDSPWLSTNVKFGQGEGTISIVADPALAPIGITSGVLLVDDGDSSKTINVTFNNRGEIIEEKVQEIYPSILEFTGTLGNVGNTIKNIRINNSKEITIESTVNWISFSPETLPPGNNTLAISIKNANSLPVGSYLGKVNLISSFATDTINVLLLIIENKIDGLSSNNFYYAQDRVTLVMTNTVESTEALLDFETQGSRGLKLYTKEVPYYQGVATSVIGLETEILLIPESLPANLATQIYAGVKPITTSIIIYDKTMGSPQKVLKQDYKNLKFINGKRPKKTDSLTYLPEVNYIPVDGVVALSFRETENTPAQDIKITGDLDTSIELPIIETGVYTIFIRISDFDLAVGQKIALQTPAFDFTIKVTPSLKPAVQLVWLNEWQLPEIFNLTGEIEIIYDDDSHRTVKSVAGHEITSIIDVKEAKSFAVNTGNVYSEEEARWIGTILRSKKMWIQLGADRIEVLPTFRRLSVSKSRRYNLSYDLTFEAASR